MVNVKAIACDLHQFHIYHTIQWALVVYEWKIVPAIISMINQKNSQWPLQLRWKNKSYVFSLVFSKANNISILLETGSKNRKSAYKQYSGNCKLWRRIEKLHRACVTLRLTRPLFYLTWLNAFSLYLVSALNSIALKVFNLEECVTLICG